MPSSIPVIFHKYFWDVDCDKLSVEGDSSFIIERLLEYGELDSVAWLKTNYEKDKIVEVLIVSKRISPKTGSLYALYFDIPREKLECIQRPFTQKQNRF